MKKSILLAFAMSLVAILPLCAKEETKDIPIRSSNPDGLIFRSPVEEPILCSVDTDALYISVSFLLDLGYVTIEVENTTTGEYASSVVNSALLYSILPFTGSSGNWRITFTLSSGDIYVGEFEI